MLLLWSAVLFAAPPDCTGAPWWLSPSVLTLDETGVDYVAQHRGLSASLSGGKGASPSFRTSWTRMETHLALQDQNVDGVRFMEGEPERIRDLSFIAATMAAEELLNQTVDRSEVLSGARWATRMVTGPNLQLERNPTGTKVSANTRPGHRYPRQTAAQVDELGRPVRAGTLKFGAGSSVVSEEDVLDEGEIGVAWSGYVLGSNFGADALRVSVDVAQVGIDGWSPDWSGAWTVSAREALHPRWVGSVELRSLTSSPMPQHARTALNFLPFKDTNRWYVQSRYTYGFERTDRDPEHRVDLRVQFNGRWRTPASPDRYPLGQEPERAIAWSVPTPPPRPVEVHASCPETEAVASE